ncbi:hypothetical protein B0T16DRAFT_95398 [Cercophora newfieldiana]|uniref:Uncharacterized protein n=1 Tax=Cercophora newfieldiana TaxID=92897 RepID=A0AA39YGC6_9PEZI|nr:hypothetical protein B0T16DRAFT_95398 [Cercophora newfieldiana]
MSATRDSFAMPFSPPPPVDLGTYSRSMLQHTKRQMEAASTTGQQSSSPRSSQGSQAGGGPPPLPNGVASSRSRNPSQYSYQS